MIYKALHRKLKIEQTRMNWNLCFFSLPTMFNIYVRLLSSKLLEFFLTICNFSLSGVLITLMLHIQKRLNFYFIYTLQAYSLHDREVGYCQGSGFIVGLLLMQVMVT